MSETPNTADSQVASQASRVAPPASCEAPADGPAAALDALMRLALRQFGVAAALVLPGARDMPAAGAHTEAAVHDALLALRRDGAFDAVQQPFFIGDLHAEPGWLRQRPAPPLRFLACWPLRTPSGERGACLLLADPAPRLFDGAARAALDDFALAAAGLAQAVVARAWHDAELAALRAHERLLSLAIAGSGTGVWDRDVLSGEIRYSSGWKALFGYRPDELSDRIEEAYQRLHPDDRDYVKAAMQAHFEGRTDGYEVEHRIRCKDGSYKWICSRGKVVSRDAEGRALRMIGTTTDITSLRKMSDALRETAQLVTNLTNEVPGLVFQYRLLPDGRAFFPYASASVADIYELVPAQLAADATPVEQRIHPEDLALYRASLDASAAQLAPWHLEYRVVLPRQGLCWRQGDAKPQRLADGSTVWHGFITDATERKRIEAELHEFATIDALTRLPNRRHFMRQLEAELAALRRADGVGAAVLMCDLDFFKSINDQFGHALGDRALRHFADILQAHLRAGDFAGRIGGEEFAVLLRAADVSAAYAIARRIQRRIAEAPLVDGARPIVLTVSIGIAPLTPADPNVESALSRSDLALYRAKKNGRNRIECA
jgi:diguanylate cyclase (GGDEF)-like protein/PAS domain S-box-containing protein